MKSAVTRRNGPRPRVRVSMPLLEFRYLRDAVRALARKRCRPSHCGTACLCDSCAARRVLPRLERIREGS